MIKHGPDEIQPIIELIRKHVKRPRKRPILKPQDGGEYVLRWDTDKGLACPLGLLPFCSAAAPNSIRSIKEKYLPATNENGWAIDSFIEWWDSQDDPAAMDLIWPPKRKKGR